MENWKCRASVKTGCPFMIFSILIKVEIFFTLATTRGRGINT